MKTWLGCLLSLGGILWCEGTEIVAWNVMLERYLPGGLHAGGASRCESPPEQSPFFQDGDELWLVGKGDAGGRVSVATDPPLEWTVWNATSKRLVTKGEWNSIWQLHQEFRVHQLPSRIRVSIRVSDPTAQDGAVPGVSMSWIAHSETNFEAQRESDAGWIRASGVATHDETFSWIGLSLDATCGLGQAALLKFTSAANMAAGVPYCFASDADATGGIACEVVASCELLDGTPRDQAVLLQSGTNATPLKRDLLMLQRYQIGKHHALASIWADPSSIGGFAGLDQVSSAEDNPFAESFAEEIRTACELKWSEVPQSIGEWFPRSVWNLGETMKQAGILMDEGDFAGYDPFVERVFLFSRNGHGIDKFEQLFQWGCRRTPAVVDIRLQGVGESRLIARSQQKASLARVIGDKVLRKVEVEPVIGENDDLVDFTLSYEDRSPDGEFTLLRSSSIAVTGEEVKLSEVTEEGKSSGNLRMTARIIRQAPGDAVDSEEILKKD